MMSVGSLFAGIGGFDLGLERAGMSVRWQVEIDPFCNRVLAKHWPDVRRYGDIRDCGAGNLEPVDLICGGFPCQPHSLTGKRYSANDERDLWPQFHRIICELRPRWMLAENVPGLLSSDDGRFFGGILRDLAQSGYDAEWDCIPASAVGAPHLRDRVFVFAYPVRHSRKVGFFAHLQLNQARAKAPMGEFGRMACPDGWREAVTDYARRDDGLPNRVERMTALRNAVVPQVVEAMGRMIVEADR